MNRARRLPVTLPGLRGVNLASARHRVAAGGCPEMWSQGQDIAPAVVESSVKVILGERDRFQLQKEFEWACGKPAGACPCRLTARPYGVVTARTRRARPEAEQSLATSTRTAPPVAPIAQPTSTTARSPARRPRRI